MKLELEFPDEIFERIVTALVKQFPKERIKRPDESPLEFAKYVISRWAKEVTRSQEESDAKEKATKDFEL